jgi:hypothetical protein
MLYDVMIEALPWFGDIQIAADFSGKIIADFVVAGHGAAAVVGGIVPPRVFRAFAE